MFGFHPANLALRLVPEAAALGASGVGAVSRFEGALAGVAAMVAPVLAAIGWGTFNVPGDRSRSGRAPVAVRGVVRLLLELAFFGVAVWLLWDVSEVAAGLLGSAVLLHYLLSLDRIRWLLEH